MASQKVIDLINKQITREFESAYIYQGIEAYTANEFNFPGITNFFHIQAQEENSHAYLFIDYLTRIGAKIELGALAAPSTRYDSILAAFEAGLEHEKKVTAWINDIMAAAVEDKDFATQSFLKFFIDEQVEEEENFNNQIDTLKFIAGDVRAMLLFDQELAKRVFEAPQAE